MAALPIQEGVSPGLLQSLAEPGMAGMDWLAAGSLTNLAMGSGPNGALPPLPAPMLPPVPQPVPAPMLQPGEKSRDCGVDAERA